MAQIGTFKRTKTGFSGHIRTLALDAKLILVPVAKSDAENAPDYRVHLGDSDGPEIGPEIGAAWKRTGEKAGDYISLLIDDPALTQPIRANLFQSSDDKSAWILNWNRPPKRGERIDRMRHVLPIACGTVRRGPIPLFAERPSHPFVPLDDPSAVARGRGQGRPSAGACALPMTEASTMACWRRRGDWAGSRFTLPLLVGLLTIGSPVAPISALAAPVGQLTASDPYAAHVAEASRRFAIPTAWIRAVMRVESRGDRGAVSRKGALGLMQLMPKTWAQLRARYGLGRDPFDPRDNILAGAAYLREMRDRYGSPGFLAAYNAGPGRYEDYRDRLRPLPPETVAYVAALAPFVEGGAIPEPVALVAFHGSSWTRAPLFIVRADGAPNADQTPFDPPARAASTVVPVRDLTAIAPQSDGLFVALSTPGRTP